MAQQQPFTYTLSYFKCSPNIHIFSHSEAASFEYPVKPHIHLLIFA